MKPKLVGINYKATYFIYHFTKIQKKSKKTKYSIGAIESGLNPNLTTKFQKGASIAKQMILKEIDKHKDLKTEIKQLKRDLRELKIYKGKFYQYKKYQLKKFIKKVDYNKSRVVIPKIT